MISVRVSYIIYDLNDKIMNLKQKCEHSFELYNSIDPLSFLLPYVLETDWAQFHVTNFPIGKWNIES